MKELPCPLLLELGKTFVVGECDRSEVNALRVLSIKSSDIEPLALTLFNPVGEDGSLNISSWNLATICNNNE